MSAAAPVARVPAPIAGTTRYFVLLYCPAERREAFSTLLALADEIGAAVTRQAVTRQMDHSVAHARLEWWRAEAQRLARSAPEHPWLARWLRQEPRAQRIELATLVDAAAIDLASTSLAGRSSWSLPGALFALAAGTLAVPQLSAQDTQGLRVLGQCTGELEQWVASAARAPPDPGALLRLQSQQAAALDSALQPPLAPLLVWAALAAHQARRRARRATAALAGQASRFQGSRFDGFADNIVAWQAARAAAGCRFELS